MLGGAGNSGAENGRGIRVLTGGVQPPAAVPGAPARLPLLVDRRPRPQAVLRRHHLADMRRVHPRPDFQRRVWPGTRHVHQAINSSHTV